MAIRMSTGCGFDAGADAPSAEFAPFKPAALALDP
jgi:hypothetical protein